MSEVGTPDDFNPFQFDLRGNLAILSFFIKFRGVPSPSPPKGKEGVTSIAEHFQPTRAFEESGKAIRTKFVYVVNR